MLVPARSWWKHTTAKTSTPVPGAGLRPRARIHPDQETEHKTKCPHPRFSPFGKASLQACRRAPSALSGSANRRRRRLRRSGALSARTSPNCPWRASQSGKPWQVCDDHANYQGAPLRGPRSSGGSRRRRTPALPAQGGNPPGCCQGTCFTGSSSALQEWFGRRAVPRERRVSAASALRALYGPGRHAAPSLALNGNAVFTFAGERGFVQLDPDRQGAFVSWATCGFSVRPGPTGCPIREGAGLLPMVQDCLRVLGVPWTIQGQPAPQN